MEHERTADLPLHACDHVQDVAIAEGVRARRVDRLKIERGPDEPRGDLGNSRRWRALHLPMDAGDLHSQGNTWHRRGERFIRLAEQALAMACESVVVPVDEVFAELGVNVIMPVDKACALRCPPQPPGRSPSGTRISSGVESVIPHRDATPDNPPKRASAQSRKSCWATRL